MDPSVQSPDICSQFARLLSSVDLERRFYQSVIAALPLPVLLVDPDLTIAMANASFRTAAGLGNRNLFGRPVKEVFLNNALGQAVARLFEPPRPAIETVSYLPAAGTSRGYRLRLQPIEGFEPDWAARFLVVAEPLEEGSAPATSWPTGEAAEVMEEALRVLSRHGDVVASALPISHPLRSHLVEMQVAIGRIAFLRNASEGDRSSRSPSG